MKLKYYFILILSLIECCIFIRAFQLLEDQDERVAADLMRTIVEHMNEYSDGDSELDRSYLDRSDPSIRTRFAFDANKDDGESTYLDVIDEGMIPSVRDAENLPPSSLWDHQFIAGGAGEGEQNLKPKGSIPNKDEVKSDAKLPSYCNPPNPCPLGFSADDGCIQRFENTAAFSREYQASQKCICDMAHMFNCPYSYPFSSDHDLEFEPLIGFEKEMNMKKMFSDKVENPFLLGELLPVAAKKGIYIGY